MVTEMLHPFPTARASPIVLAARAAFSPQWGMVRVREMMIAGLFCRTAPPAQAGKGAVMGLKERQISRSRLAKAVGAPPRVGSFLIFEKQPHAK